MPLDTSIYSRFQPQQIDLATPLANLQALDDRRMQRQQAENQLKIQGQQIQQNQTALDEDAAYKQALQESGGDIRKALPKIMQVAPRTGAALQKQLQEWDAADLTKKKTILELQGKRSERIGQLAATARDEASWQAAIQTAVGEGLLDAEAAAQLGPFDPARVAQIAQQALSAKEQLAAAQEQLKFDESKRHNQAIEVPAEERGFQAWYKRELAASGQKPNALLERQYFEKWQTAKADEKIRVARASRPPREHFELLSEKEVKRLGLPAGTVAQRGSNGKVDIISRPNARMTGAHTTALRYFLRGKQASDDIANVEEQIAAMSLPGQARLNRLPNFLQSDAGKLYNQASKAFTEARLRKDSGAAIPPSEFENDRQMYFAQPGDTPEVLEQKRRSRMTALEGIAQEAGPAYEDYFGEEFVPGSLATVAPGDKGSKAKPDSGKPMTITLPSGRKVTLE